MDFGSLLHAAQKNGQTNKNGGNYYKTKFEPPKKENKSRTLSANIQKFLAKKEEEEKQKLEEAKKKRDDLLSLRDVKATNKIKKMLKVIKSANKSVLEDAVDNNNTAVTMVGPDQPDEDDYGYVSQEASAFYSKMMEKYKSIPEEDKKFASSRKNVNCDLLGTKDRVKAAIIRHQEEEAMPHRRKRKSRTTGDSGRDSQSDYEDDAEETKQEEKKIEKPKPKRPAPPPLDFNELLKIAEKKQFEPVVIEKKPEKIEEPERLMTKKQKREYDHIKALKESKLRRERERENHSSDKEISKKRKTESPVNTKPINPLSIRIPKIGDKLNKPNPAVTKKSSDSSHSSSSKPLDKERPKALSDEKHRRDDSKISERKSDISKNIRTNSNINSHPKVSENLKTQVSSSSSAKHLINSKNPSQRPDKKDIKSSVPEKPRNISGNPNSSSTKPAPKPSSLQNNKIGPSKSVQRDVTPSGMNKARPAQTTPNASRGASDSKVSSGTSNIREKKLETPKLPMKSTGSSKTVNHAPVQKQQPKPLNSQPKPTPSSVNKLGKRPMPEDTGHSKQGSLSGSSNPKQLKSSSDGQRSRPFPPADVKKTRQFPPPDVKSRQFPPSDVRGIRQFPPRDMIPRKEKPRPVKRQILDDDSEYDSEMDDFIDDGPQDDGNDYSKHIKEIFGYDKSRYRDADEDDRNMESNFSQVMREEYISKKIGIMEDLEDMRMEALEKKQKMQRKKGRILD